MPQPRLRSPLHNLRETNYNFVPQWESNPGCCGFVLVCYNPARPLALVAEWSTGQQCTSNVDCAGRQLLHRNQRGGSWSHFVPIFRYLPCRYYLVPAMSPKMLIMVDEKGEPTPVSVRVGQAIDTVGMVGKPKQITGKSCESSFAKEVGPAFCNFC